jgi:hypothetical protein
VQRCFVIIPVQFVLGDGFAFVFREGFDVSGGDRLVASLCGSSHYRFICFVLTPHLQRVAFPQPCSPSRGKVKGNRLYGFGRPRWDDFVRNIVLSRIALIV